MSGLVYMKYTAQEAGWNQRSYASCKQTSRIPPDRQLGQHDTYIQLNNYIGRSYRDVIVITKFAITKFATRRASKAQSIVMY